jgi:hypothetical protein
MKKRLFYMLMALTLVVFGTTGAIRTFAADNNEYN